MLQFEPSNDMELQVIEQRIYDFFVEYITSLPRQSLRTLLHFITSSTVITGTILIQFYTPTEEDRQVNNADATSSHDMAP